MAFLMEIFFPGGTHQVTKYYGNSRGREGMTSTPLEWKFQGGGRSKIKVPSVGGMHSFWNYTTRGQQAFCCKILV